MMTVLPTPAPPKMPILPPLRERADQVDDLDAGLEDLGLGRLLVERRRRRGGSAASSARRPGPCRRSGWPRTLKTRPSVASPTGHGDRRAGVDARRCRAPGRRSWSWRRARTQLLPRCCWTSHDERLLPSRWISTALKIAGSWPAGNSMSTTGPVICDRPVPVAVGAAVAMVVVDASSCARQRRLRAGRDLDHLAGDVGLANLVVGQGQVLDELLGVLGRVLHRDHLADCSLAVAPGRPGRGASRRSAAGAARARPPAFGSKMNWLPGMPSVSSARLDRQQLVERRPLDERRDEARVDEVDRGRTSPARKSSVISRASGRTSANVGPVAEARRSGARSARRARRIASRPLRPTVTTVEVAASCSVISRAREADRVRVERARPGRGRW